MGLRHLPVAPVTRNLVVLVMKTSECFRRGAEAFYSQLIYGYDETAGGVIPQK